MSAKSGRGSAALLRFSSNSLDHGSDVTVLENPTSTLSFLDGDVHHFTCQVIGTNHLVRKQQLKRGVDGAHQSIAEIRFLPRLHGIDVRRPEEATDWETSCLLATRRAPG